MTSVYQRSKSADIAVSCLGSAYSSGVEAMSLRLSRLGLGGRGPGELGRGRVHLGQQHRQQLFLGHGPEELALLEDDALAAAAGDADVGVAGLGRAVGDAAHHEIGRASWRE